MSGIVKKMRLRWRLLYADKKEKVGIWDGDSESPMDRLYNQPMIGLKKVFIDAETIFDHQQFKVVDIDANEFRGAQWEANAIVPFDSQKTASIRPKINGISVFTGHEKISVFVDGSIGRWPIHSLSEVETH